MTRKKRLDAMLNRLISDIEQHRLHADLALTVAKTVKRLCEAHDILGEDEKLPQVRGFDPGATRMNDEARHNQAIGLARKHWEALTEELEKLRCAARLEVWDYDTGEPILKTVVAALPPKENP